MAKRGSKASWLLLVVSGVCAPACSATDVTTEALGTDAVADPIVGGVRATDYPEAALIDASAGFVCSGAAIAPRVILTAGHCISTGSYTVTLPYAGGQRIRSSGRGEVLDYFDNGDTVDPDAHDVGLIYLSSDVNLDTYGGFPTIATSKLPNGAKGINVGRIQNGSLSSTHLFKGRAVTLRDATPDGYPFDYASDEIIQSGDSGGPTFDAAQSKHVIVAVNSGAGDGTQVLARTDLVFSWIEGRVAAHGGWGTTGGGASSSSSGGASSSSSGGGSTCAAEREPNDTSSNANDLGSCFAGALGGGDSTDWSTWRIDTTGARYRVALDATGDAALHMWKKSDGDSTWRSVALTGASEIANAATGPGVYLVAVYTPSSTRQTYELTLTK